MMFAEEIEAAARRHFLPVGLVHAIVQVESTGNPWAMRYERGFFRAYLEGRSDPLTSKTFGPTCSFDTEKAQRATSWGLMQIMGQVARERGCEYEFLSELCVPEKGLEWGCRQLAHLWERRGPNWDDVISSYNQGSPRKAPSGPYLNQYYVDRVRKLWPASSSYSSPCSWPCGRCSNIGRSSCRLLGRTGALAANRIGQERPALETSLIPLAGEAAGSPPLPDVANGARGDSQPGGQKPGGDPSIRPQASPQAAEPEGGQELGDGSAAIHPGIILG